MITVTRQQQEAIVRPEGNGIVAATSDELRSKLRGLIEDGVRRLALDLAEVVMVDSSGIGLLIAAHNSLRKAGGHMEVIHATPEILELFQSMRMHQHFPISGMGPSGEKEPPR